MFKRTVFISHSSENREIAEQLCGFLTRLGISNNNVFCSSMVGQGISNGEKLNEAIAATIRRSQLITYILSSNFNASSYCMEELGIGWYLSQNKKVSCFYLVLPDLEMSELKGFVNSKIDKFSLIENAPDLGLFAEDFCKKLHLKVPKYSIISNSSKIFLSAIASSLVELRTKKETMLNEEKARVNKIKELEDRIEEKVSIIERFQTQAQISQSERKKRELKIELDTICCHFDYLGFGSGITIQEFKKFSKNFWFDMVNRYLKLHELLAIQPESYSMELLLATIYAANGDSEKAYLHAKNYVELYTGYISIEDLCNILPCYKDSMQEIIDIIEAKNLVEDEGNVKDSYIQILKDLRQREESIKKQA